MRKTIFAKEAPEPVGPYSQAVLANGTLYCSGQIAVDRLDRDVAVQTEAACRNLAAVLAAAGGSLADVVKTTCFLADMDDFARFNPVYETHFPHKPARSCVAAKQLPKGALVEIDAIAVL